MRLSDLLRVDVVTTDGRDLGHVHDVRLVQDGPMIGEWGAALRVHELVVGRGSIGTRLGYDRGIVRGPWLIRMIFGHRRPRSIPWHAVQSFDHDRIVVDEAEVEHATTEQSG